MLKWIKTVNKNVSCLRMASSKSGLGGHSDLGEVRPDRTHLNACVVGSVE